MASYMMQEMGLKSIASVSKFFVSKEEARIQRIMQKHNNIMTALSAAQSHNQINRNAVEIERQYTLANAADQVVAMQDQEAARLAAAASGTSGNAVATTMHDLARAEAQKRYANEKARDTAHIDINDQRRQVELSKVYGTNIDVLPKPSFATALLGLGTSLLDTWREHNPETATDSRR